MASSSTPGEMSLCRGNGNLCSFAQGHVHVLCRPVSGFFGVHPARRSLRTTSRRFIGAVTNLSLVPLNVKIQGD